METKLSCERWNIDERTNITQNEIPKEKDYGKIEEYTKKTSPQTKKTNQSKTVATTNSETITKESRICLRNKKEFQRRSQNVDMRTNCFTAFWIA